MICDEVMAGFFRTGKWFAWQNFDFVPDMITFAKGVTCGYVQLGGVIVNKKVANAALMISNIAQPIEILTYVKLECPLWTEGIEPKRLKKIAEDVINAGYKYCKDPRVDTFEDWKELLEKQYGVTHEELQQILYLNERGEM